MVGARFLRVLPIAGVLQLRLRLRLGLPLGLAQGLELDCLLGAELH
jgi:hypothetical protein